MDVSCSRLGSCVLEGHARLLMHLMLVPADWHTWVVVVRCAMPHVLRWRCCLARRVLSPADPHPTPRHPLQGLLKQSFEALARRGVTMLAVAQLVPGPPAADYPDKLRDKLLAPRTGLLAQNTLPP